MHRSDETMTSVVLILLFCIAQHAVGYPNTPIQPRDSTVIIPSTPQSGPSTAQFSFHSEELDAPELSLVNSSTWEWWYYDVVAPDQTSSFVMAFFSAPSPGFTFLPPGLGSMDVVGVWGTFPNGTAFTNYAPASQVTITQSGSSSIGNWEGTGVNWSGAGDGSSYVVTFDSPVLGVKGTLSLQSLSPPHLTCGAATPGAGMTFMPHIGWLSIAPHAVGTVDLLVGGEPLSFSGSGYHDKNWSDLPFTQNLASWFWGHGNIGPYSVMYFDGLTIDGVESRSGHVTRDGVVLFSGCNNVTARPTGVNSTYPPKQSSGNPGGFHVEFDLGEEGILVVDIKPNLIIVQALEVFARWVGSMTGGIVGQETYNGAVLFEEFRLLA